MQVSVRAPWCSGEPPRTWWQVPLTRPPTQGGGGCDHAGPMHGELFRSRRVTEAGCLLQPLCTAAIVNVILTPLLPARFLCRRSRATRSVLCHAGAPELSDARQPSSVSLSRCHAAVISGHLPAVPSCERPGCGSEDCTEPAELGSARYCRPRGQFIPVKPHCSGRSKPPEPCTCSNTAGQDVGARLVYIRRGSRETRHQELWVELRSASIVPEKACSEDLVLRRVLCQVPWSAWLRAGHRAAAIAAGVSHRSLNCRSA